LEKFLEKKFTQRRGSAENAEEEMRSEGNVTKKISKKIDIASLYSIHH